MKDSRTYTLVYSFALGGICSLLLTAAGAYTRPRKEANARAEEVRHVLRVLGIPYPEKAGADELVTIFDEKVESRETADGASVYAYGGAADGSVPAGVAIPLAGPGLWGPIKGFLCMDSSMETVLGVTFHEQEETPGLGGEIASEWFCAQFKGKKIRDASGVPGMVVGGPGNSAQNGVDAITGATMTCLKVQAILNGTIQRIVKDRGGNG